MRSNQALIAALAVIFLLTACEKAEYIPPKWSVGDWVEYHVKSSSSSLKDYTLRFAITGEEKVANETYYWLEMVGTSEGSRFVYKMLVPYGYRGVAERMIIKVEDQPALEMPKAEGLADEPPGDNRPYLFLETDVAKGKIDEAKINVPAGDYLAVHSKVKDLNGREAEVWLSKEIPLFGIVKAKIGVEDMEFVAKGKDAKTVISEEPQKIDIGIFE